MVSTEPGQGYLRHSNVTVASRRLELRRPCPNPGWAGDRYGVPGACRNMPAGWAGDRYGVPGTCPREHVPGTCLASEHAWAGDRYGVPGTCQHRHELDLEARDVARGLRVGVGVRASAFHVAAVAELSRAADVVQPSALGQDERLGCQGDEARQDQAKAEELRAAKAARGGLGPGSVSGKRAWPRWAHGNGASPNRLARLEVVWVGRVGWRCIGFRCAGVFFHQETSFAPGASGAERNRIPSFGDRRPDSRGFFRVPRIPRILGPEPQPGAEVAQLAGV